MSNYRKITYTLTDADVPCSLRNFLKRRGYSHRVLSALKQDESLVLVDGVPGKLSRYVESPCELTVFLDEGESAGIAVKPQAAAKVVYEDGDVIVFYKPAFMPTHPSHNHQGDSLCDFAAFYASQKGENYTFRPVGRLDRNTSGLVAAAKTAYAASRLSGKVDKYYFAAAEGKISEPVRIDAPIRRVREGCVLREVGEGGENAVTDVTPLYYNEENGLTLIKVHLLTGRTHQIRVHLSHIGHPLAGDDLYCGSLDKGISRHALHCGEMSFIHPVTGEKLEFTSDLPDDMKKLF